MDPIQKILERAELLFERNQLHMCSKALDEIAERLKTSTTSDALYERYEALCQRVPSEEDIVGLENVEKCGPCNGTGRYRDTSKTCFACKGKGKQNAQDQVRNQNYWARRQRIAGKAALVDKWL
jgi:DnaJ-class molecular chaperone